MKREVDWNSWALFVLIVVIPAILIAISTADAFPESLKIIGGLLIIIVGFCAYAVWNSNEPEATVRRIGLVGKWFLAGVLVFNLGGHVSMTRELSAAHDGEREQQERDKWQQQLKDKDADREVKLGQARAQEYQAQAELERRQANKLAQLPLSQRRISGPAYKAPAQSGSPADAASVRSPLAVPGQEPPKLRTPAEVRESWRNWMFWMAMLEVGVAVVFGATVLSIKHWDGNRDGIPDWLERMYEQNPDWVRQQFPHHYAVLRERRQQAAMGNP